jgi:hypothetical protein
VADFLLSDGFLMSALALLALAAIWHRIPDLPAKQRPEDNYPPDGDVFRWWWREGRHAVEPEKRWRLERILRAHRPADLPPEDHQP